MAKLYIPLDLAIHRIEEMPYSSANGIVRNANAPSFPPKLKFAVGSDVWCPDQLQHFAANQPYVLVYDPMGN
jgi:hypothetical protein